MVTNYFDESMRYERASSECFNIMQRLRNDRAAAEERARESGDKEPDFYGIIIEDIKAIKKKYDDLSAQYYKMHKSDNPDLDDNGIINLLSAIVKSWALDYETAISRGDAERMIYLRKEGKNLVKDTTVERIERKRKDFANTAHNRLFDIVEDTAKVAHDHTRTNGVAQNDRYLKHRCPLCGGGMYAKRIKPNTYLVKCTRCYLTDLVEIGS